MSESPLAIDIADATVFLGGREILHQLHWQLPRGERCFILGANGAGKTTLVRMLLGYAWPLFGARVEVLGARFGHVNLKELRRRIAWVSPLVHQWLGGERAWTGREMVLSGIEGTIGLFCDVSEADEQRAAELLELLHAERLADRLVHQMSSGEQVKILIARALMADPELMILDEPSVFLDLAGREFLLQTIESLAQKCPDLTMIFITQRIEDILPSVFTHGMILRDGHVLARGSREDILTPELLSDAYGLNIRLMEGRDGRLWSMIES